MAFATKLSHIVYADGTAKDIMKMPKTDTGKISLPGILSVKAVDGVPTIFPADEAPEGPELLETIYDKRPLDSFKFDDFDTVRERANATWRALPKTYNPISAPLKKKIDGKFLFILYWLYFYLYFCC